MSLLFSPFDLPSPRGGLRLANRMVVAPMCQYAANEGETSDWHLMHWGNLFNSGAGMLAIEATAVCLQLAHTGRKASCAVPWDVYQLPALDAGGSVPEGWDV